MPLTRHQTRMLDHIRAYIAKRRQSPTIAELRALMGQGYSGDTRAMLKRLVDAGAITRTPGAPRGITITGDET